MASIHDQIKEVVTTHRVVLFMKGTKQFPQCGYCLLFTLIKVQSFYDLFLLR